MIHKLTIAIFPSPDKFIRCMFGPKMEELFGNRQSFPMCGFSQDSWVLAIRRKGAYIPLAKIGPDHESWGMTRGRDGWPYIVDAWKQHVVYAARKQEETRGSGLANCINANLGGQATKKYS